MWRTSLPRSPLGYAQTFCVSIWVGSVQSRVHLRLPPLCKNVSWSRLELVFFFIKSQERERMAAEGFLVCVVQGARHRADGKQMAAHNTADRASAVSAHNTLLHVEHMPPERVAISESEFRVSPLKLLVPAQRKSLRVWSGAYGGIRHGRRGNPLG